MNLLAKGGGTFLSHFGLRWQSVAATPLFTVNRFGRFAVFCKTGVAELLKLRHRCALPEQSTYRLAKLAVLN